MLGFGALLGGKLKMAIGAAIIIAAASAYHFYTVSSLNSEIAAKQEEIVVIEKENNTLRTNNSELAFQVDQISEINAQNVENLTAEVERQKSKIDDFIAESKQLRSDYSESLKEKTRLKELLSKHDLEYLASMKPKLVENRMNKATKQVLSDLEDASNAD